MFNKIFIILSIIFLLLGCDKEYIILDNIDYELDIYDYTITRTNQSIYATTCICAAAL